MFMDDALLLARSCMRSNVQKPDTATWQRSAKERSPCSKGAMQSATTKLWHMAPWRAQGTRILLRSQS